MRRTLIIHPIMFAIFPIFAFYAHNIEELSPSVIIVPSVVIIFLSCIAWVLLSAIFKNTIKAALIVSFFVMMFFSYGHFINPIIDFKLYGILIGRHVYFLPIWSILIIGGIYYIPKTENTLYNLTRYLNIVSVFLVMISIVQIGVYEIKTRGMKDYSNKDRIILEEKYILKKGDVLRDIYYIIFDTYGSNRTLKEYYNYDNSRFIEYLTEQGFYVAYDSRTNYPYTFLSLASSLNMKYLNYLTQELGENSTDRTPVIDMIKNNKVTRILKAMGYKYIHFGSWWEPTRVSKYAYINVNYGIPLSEFFTKLFINTMIYPVITKYIQVSKELVHRKRVLYKFERLAEIPKIEGPKFIFAHMVVPHRPFVFGKNGEPLTKLEVRRRSEDDNYLNQLIFITKKIELLVSKILSKSKVPPIIIIQSDEGPVGDKSVVDENGLMIESEIRKKTEIINAYYLPNVKKDILYSSISPVNTFRVIFNNYFNADYELLKDESYVLPQSYDKPYKFLRVTDVGRK